MVLLKHAWAWILSIRWYLWAALALGVAILLFVLKMVMAKKGQIVTPEGSMLPQVPKVLQDKVDQVQEAAVKQRIEATVRADTDRAELDRIASEKDASVRRQRLAEMLKRL